MTTNEATKTKTKEGATDMQKNDKVIQMKREGISDDTSFRSCATVEVFNIQKNHLNADETYLLCKMMVENGTFTWIHLYHDGEEITVDDSLVCTIELRFTTERRFHYQLIDIQYRLPATSRQVNESFSSF